ncbi:hypothetical protein H1R20_g14856, partial [Candolleomyces eurysporus]
MGGSAFHALLGKQAFPRVPPGLYSTLKARLLPKVRELYSFVAIPVEAPEKMDYGDLDFVVAGPKPCTETGVERAAIPHGMVQTALGAKHVIPMDGNRTSHYAVPISVDEYEVFFNLVQEDSFSTSNLEIFLQTADSWTRILPFLGLSQETFNSGFQTKTEVFQWVASMKHFNPRFFRSTGPGMKKVKPERKMYAEFISWIEQEYLKNPSGDDRSQKSMKDHTDIDMIAQMVKLEALEYFEKASEFQALIEADYTRQRLRSSFSGHQVRDWADMGNYWPGVKKIMDTMRAQMGGDEGVLRFLEDKGEEELCAAAIRVRNELGLIPNSERQANIP